MKLTIKVRGACGRAVCINLENIVNFLKQNVGTKTFYREQKQDQDGVIKTIKFSKMCIEAFRYILRKSCH